MEELDATIRNIRGAIFELGRDQNGKDLRGQIRDVLAASASSLGFRPGLLIDGAVESVVPDIVRPHLIAVLVETLSNAARHADAGRVNVRLAVEGDESGRVVLEVADDGKGFTPTGRESGLRNFRERARQFGGACVVESKVGGGTLVRWSAPLTV